jgi:hypothetical protein
MTLVIRARTILFLTLYGLLTVGPRAQAESNYHTMPFPPAHDLFAPLQVDPTELRFAVYGGAPISQRSIMRVDIGDYFGVYRWAFPRGLGGMQLNVGGGIFNRFDATTSHALQVIDYYGNVPLDVRLGPVSGRFMFYHDSSHLGDDYLREKNIQSVDHSWEALRGILSGQPSRAIRLYGGYTQAVHTKPVWRGREAIQGGLEIFIHTPAHVFLHPFWATDVQAWHRSAWTPTWTSQLGVKTGSEKSKGRGISYFIQFQTGPRFEGQFFTSRETIWTGGLKFQISQAPISPETPSPSPQP